MDLDHKLMEFGLTHQEAKLYLHLRAGPATGYEMAKASGISRSNTYAGLSSLVEKGAAWLIDGKPVRYQAVPLPEFCGNVIRSLERTKALLEQQAQPEDNLPEGYLTITGEQNIRNKIETMIEQTAHHIYLSMQHTVLELFLPTLSGLAGQGCKVVVITDTPPLVDGVTVYRNREQPPAIRVISDTRSALTGNAATSCLYSREQNLVSLLRDSMRNEIRLIEMEGEQI